MFTFADHSLEIERSWTDDTFSIGLCNRLQRQTLCRKIGKKKRNITHLVLENVSKTVHPMQKWHIRCTVLVDLRVNILTHYGDPHGHGSPFVSKRQQLSFGLAVFSKCWTRVYMVVSSAASFSQFRVGRWAPWMHKILRYRLLRISYQTFLAR